MSTCSIAPSNTLAAIDHPALRNLHSQALLHAAQSTNLYQDFYQKNLRVSSDSGSDQAEHFVSHLYAYLDQHFPLLSGSHREVVSYQLYFNKLIAYLNNGQCSGLRQPQQYVSFEGRRESPSEIRLANQQRAIALHLNASSHIGQLSQSGIENILVER